MIIPTLPTSRHDPRVLVVPALYSDSATARTPPCLRGGLRITDEYRGNISGVEVDITIWVPLISLGFTERDSVAFYTPIAIRSFPNKLLRDTYFACGLFHAVGLDFGNRFIDRGHFRRLYDFGVLYF